ncbi:uncharacterized protein [Medicago truncatula]|uniref:uncharacterized protein n=1 Tax=Medicago truncatula TaxID=3880 RepID=UPI0000D5D60B|nr:uncharacterized protein LOC112416589 [Medicago truncatula]
MAWEEDSVRECSALLNNVILQKNIQDYWRWLLDPIQGYSVRETYRFLTFAAEPTIASDCNDVWNKLVPAKVSIFAWRLFQDRISTRANLVRQHVLQPTDNLCVGGCGSIETANHLFLGCNLFGTVWYLVCQWLGISFVFPGHIRDHYFQFTHLAGLSRTSYSYLKVIWLASVWAIWKIETTVVFLTRCSEFPFHGYL